MAINFTGSIFFPNIPFLLITSIWGHLCSKEKLNKKAQFKGPVRLILSYTQNYCPRGWGDSSEAQVPAGQVQGREFEPQSCKIIKIKILLSYKE